MSTEGRRSRHRWRRYAPQVALFAALSLVAACLAGANLSQPPRVKSVEANGELLISRTEQRVQLHLSQPVSAITASAVAISPQTPIEVTSAGSTITLRFPAMLRTGTDYHVDVRVRGAATGAAGTISATFATPDPATYTLVRSADGDRLLEHRVHDATATRTTFEAAHIQEYASAPSGLAVITRDTTGRAELAIHEPRKGTAGDSRAAGGSATPYRIMTSDLLGQLRSDAASGIVGVVASGTGDDRTVYDRALLIADPATRSVATVADGDGATAAVRDWRFVPGSTSLIYQRPDGRLFGWEAAPEPRSFDLGVTGDLLDFLPGTKTLAVSNSSGVSLIDLSGAVSGTLDAPLPQTPLGAEFAASPASPAVLALSADTALERQAPGSATLPEVSPAIDLRSIGSPLLNGSVVTAGSLVVSENGGNRPLFSPASANTRIGRACLSPNAEFAAIETVSSEGAPDARPVTPGFSHTTTTYVRVATGDTVRSAIGGLSDWCA